LNLTAVLAGAFLGTDCFLLEDFYVFKIPTSQRALTEEYPSLVLSPPFAAEPTAELGSISVGLSGRR